MILIQFINKIKVFEDVNEALKEMEKVNIHPDLLKIFKGDFKPTNYLELLDEANILHVDEDKLKEELVIIRKNFQEKLMLINENFLIEDSFYAYSSPSFHFLFKNGFNPFGKFSLNLEVAKEEDLLNSHKIRKIIEGCLINDWKLLKVTENRELKSSISSIWKNYLIFITKERKDCELKNDNKS